MPLMALFLQSYIGTYYYVEPYHFNLTDELIENPPITIGPEKKYQIKKRTMFSLSSLFLILFIYNYFLMDRFSGVLV